MGKCGLLPGLWGGGEGWGKGPAPSEHHGPPEAGPAGKEGSVEPGHHSGTQLPPSSPNPTAGKH